jgi:hypothetical protein
MMSSPSTFKALKTMVEIGLCAWPRAEIQSGNNVASTDVAIQREKVTCARAVETTANLF